MSTAAEAGAAPSVAIIMDGNRRWAEGRGLSVADGHREGTRALRRTVEAAIDRGVGSIAVYGFSTENWTRPADEVATLTKSNKLLSDVIGARKNELYAMALELKAVSGED